MGELASALDALAAEDLHALPAGAQLDRLRELAQIRNRLDAELARSVRVAETTQAAEHDGLKTMASWLRGHCHLSPRAAGLLVRGGRALAHLPAVAAACAAGQITADQLAVIAPITTPANLAAAAEAGRRPRRDRPAAGRRSRSGSGMTASPRWCGHYLARARPRRPRTRPHRGPVAAHRPARRRHAARGRFDLDAGRRGEGGHRPGVDPAEGPLPRRHPHPRPAARRRPGPAGRPRPGRRRAAHPAHRQAARRGTARHRGPGRPRHRPRRAGHARRPRRGDLRRPRLADAGLRRQLSPGS